MARAEWVIELANYHAKADQDPAWESKMKRMLQTIRKKATKRKLKVVLKGPHQSVQSVGVPKGEWFY